jgi:hypothetical protein
MIRILAFWLMGSYVVGVYLAGAALELPEGLGTCHASPIGMYLL